MHASPLTPPLLEVPALDIGFTDTSADQLRFSLHHPRLTPLASELIDLPTEDADSVALRLELHVIGSSHQVVLGRDGTDAFVETFACLGAGAEGTVHHPEWDRTSVTHGNWAGFTRHEFRCTRRLVPGDFGSAVAEVLRRDRDAESHVAVGFPGDPHAITALATRPGRPGELSWQTWHCYPQHRQIVHSTSRLCAGGRADSDDTEMNGGRS